MTKRKISDVLVSDAMPHPLTFISYRLGGIINFTTTAAGGEFATIGLSIINMLQKLGANPSPSRITAMIAIASMYIAYGKSVSNL